MQVSWKSSATSSSSHTCSLSARLASSSPPDTFCNAGRILPSPSSAVARTSPPAVLTVSEEICVNDVQPPLGLEASVPRPLVRSSGQLRLTPSSASQNNEQHSTVGDSETEENTRARGCGNACRRVSTFAMAVSARVWWYNNTSLVGSPWTGSRRLG